jgi:DNA-binding transcriptional MerR regulator
MLRIGFQTGRVSAETGLSVDAIWFYEKQRLLERVERTEGGFRRLTASDIQRLKFVQRAQKLGFSLPEIRELRVLQNGDAQACCHVRDLLRAKIADVRSKVRHLEALDKEPTKSLRKCERTLRAGDAAHRSSCPLLNEVAHRGPDED